MKKFTTDRPGYGLFDTVSRGPRLERAVPRGGQRQARLALSTTVWELPRSRRAAPKSLYLRGGKRTLDITLVLLSAPFWLPLVAICALALWLEGGQPFYRQDRLGRKGARFSILKLRTMVPDADAVLADLLARDSAVRAEWDSLQKLRNDPRITPIGQFLRSTSLDELPQLINVLKGDMSLVGPRPMMPDQLALYGDPQAYFAARPGLTGLWQVSARNKSTFTYRNSVDESYVNAMSFRLDATIIYKTFGVVLRRTGC